MFQQIKEFHVITFTKSVADFLEAAEAWLLPEDYPATVSLQHMAAGLDKEMTPALLSQFGLAYRSLLKKKPADNGDGGDELDDILPD